MNTEILGVVAMFLITLVLAIPFGKYIAKVYGGEKTWFDPILNPIDNLIFKAARYKVRNRNDVEATPAGSFNDKPLLVYYCLAHISKPGLASTEPRW